MINKEGRRLPIKNFLLIGHDGFIRGLDPGWIRCINDTLSFPCARNILSQEGIGTRIGMGIGNGIIIGNLGNRKGCKRIKVFKSFICFMGLFMEHAHCSQ